MPLPAMPITDTLRADLQSLLAPQEFLSEFVLTDGLDFLGHLAKTQYRAELTDVMGLDF